MAEKTGIGWTDHTFNSWIGCEAVSPACDHCYAETLDKRAGGFGDKEHPGALHWGADAPRKMMSESYWFQPVKWNRAAALAGVPKMVFCASLADVFEDRLDLEQPRARLFKLIEETPWLRWQLLTKRPQNINSMAPVRWVAGGFPSNVWVGTTAEDQPHFNVRVRRLLDVNASVRFLSMEPLVGPVDVGDLSGIHWVIVGGESGPGWRPMPDEWVAPIIDACAARGVPVFYKQPSAFQPPHGLPFRGKWYHELPCGLVSTAPRALAVTGG